MLMIVKYIRTYRILTEINSFRKILTSLIKTIPELSKNFASFFALILFYSLCGLILFNGIFEYRCR